MANVEKMRQMNAERVESYKLPPGLQFDKIRDTDVPMNGVFKKTQWIYVKNANKSFVLYDHHRGNVVKFLDSNAVFHFYQNYEVLQKVKGLLLEYELRRAGDKHINQHAFSHVIIMEPALSLLEYITNFISNAPEKEIFDIKSKLIHAVKAMHDNEFVHGDIKADNIYVFIYSKPLLVKFGDFETSGNVRHPLAPIKFKTYGGEDWKKADRESLAKTLCQIDRIPPEEKVVGKNVTYFDYYLEKINERHGITEKEVVKEEAAEPDGFVSTADLCVDCGSWGGSKYGDDGVCKGCGHKRK